MCNSSMVKSPSLSTISTLSRWRPRFLRHKRPLSLDLSYSYPEDEAYVQSSNDTIPDASIAETVANELPLPPRCPRKRPLRGTKPPPRHLLGPKPPRFQTDGQEDDKKNSELAIVYKEKDEVYTYKKYSELDYKNIDSDEEQDSLFENEAEEAPDYMNLEEMKQNWLTVHTDSRLEAPDLISESSTDTTVVTAIEMKGKMLVPKHASVSRETSKSIVSDSIYDTSVSSTSVMDYTKLTKDIQNKMSKESSQRSARNLATEISDFFKISASKLRPPCLHSRKDTAIEQVVIKTMPVPQNKVRLIPRSPYIAPVKFEHVVHRTQPKQTPFWEVNPNKADGTSLAYSKSLSPINNWCDTKFMKNLENAARKKLLIRDGDNSEPITRSEKKAYEHKVKQLLMTRSEQHTYKLMARDLKLKSRLYLSMNDKMVTKLPTDTTDMTESADNSKTLIPDLLIDHTVSEKLQQTSTNLLITQYSLDYQLTPKKPKVIMPPVPRITLRTIKTQLPCDFPTLVPKSVDRLLNKSVDKSVDLSEKSSLLPKEKSMQAVNNRRSMYMRFIRRQQKKYNNDRHYNIDEFADIIFEYKPDNTWPPKNYRRRKKK